MNATRRQIVSSLPVYLLFGVVAAPTANGQVTAKTVRVEQALATPNETKPASFFWGDYDGDGFDDAFVIAPSGQAQLLRNLGDGTLAETTAQAGLSGLVAPTFASWSDMDLDGDLDLFIGTSVGPSGLFLNEGQGTFTEIAALAGLTHTGADEHGGWLDYDRDGLPDLHVRTKTESLLYRNLGGAAFERVELGLAPIAPIALGGVGVTPVATAGAAPAGANDPTNTTTPQPAPSGNTSASDSAAPTGRSRRFPSTAIPQPIAVNGTGTTTNSAPGTGSVFPAGSAPGTLSACAVGIEDQANPGAMGCLQASTQPTLGMLYPLSKKLFVSSSGRVGIGTTSPATKLHVAGSARVVGKLTLAPSGDQALNVSTGSIYKGGALFLHTKGGIRNTALGKKALESVTTGSSNTAIGDATLFSNTTGYDNVGIGVRALYFNTTGYRNTATGFRALYFNTTGNENTATGYRALDANTTGVDNTAHGAHALRANTTGYSNTASGSNALYSNTTGRRNTAVGDQALFSNTTGYGNTASGHKALYSNTTGLRNTAVGGRALMTNSTGISNVATGYIALYLNTTGIGNVATGTGALFNNTTGSGNTASGSAALYYNTIGHHNTATGYVALFHNTTGTKNIALGYGAGYYVNAGSYNIDIGNLGVSGDGYTTRIGSSQTRAFIAGIRGVTTAGAAITVMIDSAGQLGTVSSSRRFKEDIVDMGDATDRLLDLRAVLFRYKERNENGDGPIEFGLIAEEVAEVFPELVVYDDEGEPFTVKYHLLGTMLLNELQKEHERVDSQGIEIAALRGEVRALREQFAGLEQRK